VILMIKALAQLLPLRFWWLGLAPSIHQAWHILAMLKYELPTLGVLDLIQLVRLL
jgi:hypothetical protein